MHSIEGIITVIKDDLDDLNHVNNVRYVQWVQDIAEEHLQKGASKDILDNHFINPGGFCNHILNFKYIIDRGQSFSLAFQGLYNNNLISLYWIGRA